MSNRIVKVLRAGRLDYGAALSLQKNLADLHYGNKELVMETQNTLVLLEHNPVYTIGIRRNDYSEEEEKKLTKLGAQFFKTNRGGLITFHGPGQLIAYPVLNLKQFAQASIRWYVNEIEKMIIRLCAEFGIKGETSPDTGVWVNNNKICAIGIHGSRYITTHGLALNCNTDLKWFEHIVPCGIKGKGVTSISKELKQDITIDDVIPVLCNAFKDQFECSLIDYPLNKASNLLRTAVNSTYQ
ncbi:putative lipoyltransferase 2, mitochondrial isoform X2 [Neodiprion virginianus]|uniref:putative lipoyltransferase 2, mitochondrial isoform X2 n=1 Tax=Neodiprion virginianus TaxID=2961670 RepID=UPI001EE76200|nr:putative lipoyltransferase 2, mitochondrial isoform X2 [Neodiprion virginianus]XP_046616355.1 putative lipoyltransferase 2, mitochondrial isoform X2 [Neodiprion virginianus]XP_046616356.1 putative lipoyltransferase 2, mitochondrial isoform X2 [Neodiprion virginianus]XP_046616357.1 putative lipoyltransferase 2, mitochondrial isoform X2 [Neodiprion virginianus]